MHLLLLLFLQSVSLSIRPTSGSRLPAKIVLHLIGRLTILPGTSTWFLLLLRSFSHHLLLQLKELKSPCVKLLGRELFNIRIPILRLCLLSLLLLSIFLDFLVALVYPFRVLLFRAILAEGLAILGAWKLLWLLLVMEQLLPIGHTLLN